MPEVSSKAVLIVPVGQVVQIVPILAFRRGVTSFHPKPGRRILDAEAANPPIRMELAPALAGRRRLSLFGMAIGELSGQAGREQTGAGAGLSNASDARQCAPTGPSVTPILALGSPSFRDQPGIGMMLRGPGEARQCPPSIPVVELDACVCGTRPALPPQNSAVAGPGLWPQGPRLRPSTRAGAAEPPPACGAGRPSRHSLAAQSDLEQRAVRRTQTSNTSTSKDAWPASARFASRNSK